MIWGKILGAILGFIAFNFVGLVIGLLIGHSLDVNASRNIWLMSGRLATVKTHFFEALFSCMGHLAKADGRVTEDEIAVARAIMSHMQLTPEKMKQAMHHFNTGKMPNFDLHGVLNRLREESKGQKSLMRMFMQLQFQAAYADGDITPEEHQLLSRMGTILGISQREYEQLHAMFKAQHAFQQRFRQRYQSGGGGSTHSAPSKNDFDQAREVLGVSRSASKEETKRAYRKLMNEYHPDKLAAKGLPDEMMKAATEKTAQIQAAYDLLKKHQ